MEIFTSTETIVRGGGYRVDIPPYPIPHWLPGFKFNE